MSGAPFQNSTTLIGGEGTTAFAATLTVSSGTRERVKLGSVDAGRQFISARLSVSTTTDPGGDLDVGLYNGEQQVTPEDTLHTMANDEVSMPGVAVYGTGDEVEVELDNRDNAGDIQVSTLVSGTVPAVERQVEQRVNGDRP